jgi:hypothetical protein
MARSEYVYVITASGCTTGAFTVRRELAAWLEQPPQPAYRAGLRYWRFRDGDPDYDPSEMTLAEVLGYDPEPEERHA